jgi:hypothetical protein
MGGEAGETLSVALTFSNNGDFGAIQQVPDLFRNLEANNHFFY